MRYRIIALLAVWINHAAAGPLHYHQAFGSHDVYPRFYNISGAESSKQAQPDTTTKSPAPVSTESLESLQSLSTTNHPSFADVNTISSQTELAAVSTSPTSQGVTTSLHLQSSLEGNVKDVVATATGADQPLSVATLSSSPDTVFSGVPISVKPTQSSSSQSIAPVTAGGDFSAPFQSLSSNTGSATSATQISAQESPSGSALARTGSLTGSSAQVSLSAAATIRSLATTGSVTQGAGATGSPAASAVARQYPTADNGNLAMAVGYNQLFKTLNEDSSCDPKDNKSMIACIEGQPANCEVDGRYTFRSCPQGQSCYAVPHTDGQTGVNIDCFVPSDAAAKLAASPSSAAAGAASITATNPQPTSTVGQSPEAVQAIQAAANSPDGGAASTRSVARAQGATLQTSKSLAASSSTATQSPTLNVNAAAQATSSPAQTSSSIQKAFTSGVASPVLSQVAPQPISASTIRSAQTSEPPPSSAPATVHTQLSVPVPVSSATALASSHGAGTPTPAFAAAPQVTSSPVQSVNNQQNGGSSTGSPPKPSLAATQLNNGPLVLSFPSDLPSSTKGSASQIPPVPHTANNAAVSLVAQQKDTQPAQESVVQAGLSPSSAARVGGPVVANNVPATTSVPPRPSTTAQANAAGITIVPLGVDQGGPSYVKTVTVTVTTTVHDG